MWIQHQHVLSANLILAHPLSGNHQSIKLMVSTLQYLHFPHKRKACCADNHAIRSLKLSINTKAKAVPKLLGFDCCWKELEEFGWDYLWVSGGEFQGTNSMSKCSTCSVLIYHNTDQINVVFQESFCLIIPHSGKLQTGKCTHQRRGVHQQGIPILWRWLVGSSQL